MMRYAKEHTMEDALFRYLAIKMHPLILTWQGPAIVVRGCYERQKSIISIQEKTDKLFNWKRPTAEISKDNKILYINCFPGIDYVRHYAMLIKTYFRVHNLNSPHITFELPTHNQSISELRKTNLTRMPKCDIVIIGKVENLRALTNNSPWEGDGDFYWSTGRIGSGFGQVALLGCTFSLWGDIAGSVIKVLGQNVPKTLIYTGKLGGLSHDMPTNQLLATGNQSMFLGKIISWENIIKIPAHINNVVHGKHVTLFSTLAETKEWYNNIGRFYSFVDPEIGHMADVALKNKINFGYIHLVSDNVAVTQSENLSNERGQEIVAKRAVISQKILDVIRNTMGRAHPTCVSSNFR
ncbi:MAG: hypothetical protein ABH827_01290 [bacterium]